MPVIAQVDQIFYDFWTTLLLLPQILTTLIFLTACILHELKLMGVALTCFTKVF